MQVGKNNITQFLTATGICFMIPVYQRNYDWNDENCKQLWKDIWYIAQSDDNRTHFLGTICTKTVNGHEKSVIDGQQRITTLTLLMKAMHDCVDNEDFKRDIEATFIRNNGYGIKPEHRVKLHLNRRDDAIYNKLLEFDTPVSTEDIGDAYSVSSLYKNYKYFCNVISGLDECQIACVKDALDRIIIVDLDVEGENPQEIFESLNSTGLDLTDVDLLRNYLLMSLDHETQLRFYNDYWFKIEENVHPRNMVRFFIDYLIYVKKSDALMLRGRRAHINERNLYSAFKSYYESLDESNTKDRYSCSPETTELVLYDMLRCSQFYKRLVFSDGIDMNKLEEAARVIYSIVYLNEAASARPVLMYVMDRLESGEISEADALTMLKASLSLVFRAKVTRFVGINGQFAGNVLQRLPKTAGETIVDEFWRALTSGNGRHAFPTDEEFKEALTTRQVFDILRSKGAKYLFYTLEQYSATPKGLPRYDDSDITVEHIMPKKLSEKWIEYLGEDAVQHGDELNKLGNLALTTYNSEMSNNSFSAKKAWYKKSNFAETRKIAEYDDWSIDKIHSRGTELADQCVEVWNLPEQYQTKSEVKDAGKAKKRPPFQFSMIGLVEGDEVAYHKNPAIVAIVADDDHVVYDGKSWKLSKLAAHLMGKESSAGIQGPLHFTYDGETLAALREEVEANVY